ncbi:MAG: PQQ-binding-like beta-propeller repeat protein [Candidatus Xenobiia bacterium LiM19]
MVSQINIAFNNAINRIPAPEVKSSTSSTEDRFIPTQSPLFSQDRIMALVSNVSTGISIDKAADSLLKKPEPPPPAFTQLWGIKYDELSYCSSSCLGPDGSIHFKSSGGVLVSIKDGNMLLNLKVNEGCDSSVACGPDGTLYTGRVWVDHSSYASKGSITAIKDGKKLWDFQADEAIRQPAIIGNDGIIYVGDDAGNLYALKYESKLGGLLKGAKKQWSIKMNGGLCAPLSAGPDGTIYMATRPRKTYDEDVNRLHAVKNGKELWNIRFDKGIYTKPAIGPDGTIYVRCEDEKLYAIKDGKKIWDYQTGFSQEHNICIGPDGTIYLGDDERKLVAVKDGKKLWDYQPDDYSGIKATPCLGKDGTVYAGSTSGTVYAIKDGKAQWGIKSDDGIGTLLMDDKSNILNALTHKGAVYAFKINETAKNESPQTAQDILNSIDDGKAVINKPGIDESSADGWVIIGGIKLPKKS